MFLTCRDAVSIATRTQQTHTAGTVGELKGDPILLGFKVFMYTPVMVI
jgi:hypothetical protein